MAPNSAGDSATAPDFGVSLRLVCGGSTEIERGRVPADAAEASGEVRRISSARNLLTATQRHLLSVLVLSRVSGYVCGVMRGPHITARGHVRASVNEGLGPGPKPRHDVGRGAQDF